MKSAFVCVALSARVGSKETIPRSLDNSTSYVTPLTSKPQTKPARRFFYHFGRPFSEFVPTAATSPRKKCTVLPLVCPSSEMAKEVRDKSGGVLQGAEEVEIKVLLPTKADYEKAQTLFGTPARVYEQENVFFDGKQQELSSRRAVLRFRFYSADGTPKCMLTLKSDTKIQNGISRSEEVEAVLDPVTARTVAGDPAQMAILDNDVIAATMKEFGVPADGFRCLGGFKNLRQVYDWDGHKIELDKTQFAFGNVHEIEIETADPVSVKKRLEDLLASNSISFTDSTVSKFARFIKGGKVAS